MSAFDDACEYARECGIPEDKIEDVVHRAEVSERFNSGPYGEGCEAENSRSIIEAAARDLQVIEATFNPGPPKHKLFQPRAEDFLALSALVIIAICALVIVQVLGK